MKMLCVNDKIYVYGGWNRVAHYNDLFVLDLDTLKWAKVPLSISDPSEGKIGQHVFANFQDKLYMFGGFLGNAGKESDRMFVCKM
jgi:hypothetical protein